MLERPQWLQNCAAIYPLCSYLLVSWIPWWFHVSHCHIPGIYLDSRVQLLFCWVQRLQLFLELFLYPLTLLLYHGTWRFSKQNISAWGMLGISKNRWSFQVTQVTWVNLFVPNKIGLRKKNLYPSTHFNDSFDGLVGLWIRLDSQWGWRVHPRDLPQAMSACEKAGRWQAKKWLFKGGLGGSPLDGWNFWMWKQG